MSTNGRDERGRMLPGFTANPSGRPKSLLHLAELCKARTEECIEKLIYLMRNGETQAIQKDCALALLDRGWGRPSTSIDLDITLDRKLNELSTAQLLELRNKVITLPALEIANGSAEPN